MKKAILIAFCVLLSGCSTTKPVRVASKNDTEGPVLGEIVIGLLRDQGIAVKPELRFPGTPVVWEALLKDEVDIYPEYTGTLIQQVLTGKGIQTEDELRAELEKLGLGMTKPLGFANNYALGMKKDRANQLGIHTISDLRNHPDLKIGFSSEFIKREDGWPGLQKRYGLGQHDVRGMDHSLAYVALAEGSIDVTELYTTDAEINRLGLVALKDDLEFFPIYEAVLLYRLDLASRAPAAMAAIHRLEGTVSEAEMIQMNVRSQDKIHPAQIAADFLKERFGISHAVEIESDSRRLWRLTQEHLLLVGISLGAAILVSLPLGILSAARPRLGHLILGVAGVIQTIPSLALLVFMIPLLKTGTAPAVAALFLYSLLPIISGTATGLQAIPGSVRESAAALGLAPLAQLMLVELPLASRSILSGIRTSAVINVGTATLGAFIRAGGYGEPIQTGLVTNDHREILFGAVPAALLALVVQGVFMLAERFLVPRGLRLTTPS